MPRVRMMLPCVSLASGWVSCHLLFNVHAVFCHFRTLFPSVCTNLLCSFVSLEALCNVLYELLRVLAFTGGFSLFRQGPSMRYTSFARLFALFGGL